MAGPYRNNVVVAAGYTDTTFSPPLDALYVTAAPAGNITITVGSDDVVIASARFGAGTLLEVGDITAVSGGDESFAFIGLRVTNKSGSSNTKADVITTG